MSRDRSAARKLESAAPLFAALGDQTRLRLVERLCADGPLSITALSAGEGVTRQAITKHLEALASAGVVRDLHEGRERIWRVETKRIHDAQRALDRISHDWDAALDRLKAFVEDD